MIGLFRTKIGRRLFIIFLFVAILSQIIMAIRFDLIATVASLLTCAAYSVFIAIVVACLLLKWMLEPLNRLTEGTRRLADGDLSFRVSIHTKDEFAQLAHSFNDMASSLMEKQEALRASTDYLRTVLDNLPDEVVVIDRNYRITKVNTATLLKEGYKEEEIIGRYCYEVLHLSEGPCPHKETCPARTVFETGGNAMGVHLHYDKEGKGHYVEIAASPITNPEGDVVEAVEVLRDITEKKEREDKILRQSRELVAINSVSTLALTSFDIGEIIRQTLDTVLDVTGLDAGWISLLSKGGEGIYLTAHKGLSDTFVKEESEPSLCGCICEDVFVTGEPVTAEMSECKRVRKEVIEKEGLRRHICVPMRTKERVIGMMNLASKKQMVFTTEEVRFFVSIGNTTATALENIELYQDLNKKIEELRRANEGLIRSAKLAAIGELAANIAYEINNPLTGVLGYATLMMSSPDVTPSQKEMLEIIEKEALRARATVKNLLDFSKPKPPMREKRDIREAIEGALSLLRRLIEIGNIELIEDYTEGIPLVEIDMDQMKQVFINIINNAIYAMPKGGRLRLRSYWREPNVMVEVIDTGIGISPEDLQRIFDPFFTTREWEGAGLGLSISYRILEGHGGRIEAESEIGKGSIFRVILPRAK